MMILCRVTFLHLCSPAHKGPDVFEDSRSQTSGRISSPTSPSQAELQQTPFGPFQDPAHDFMLPGMPSPAFSLNTSLGLQVQILPLKFSSSLTQDKPLHLSENLFPHL